MGRKSSRGPFPERNRWTVEEIIPDRVSRNKESLFPEARQWSREGFRASGRTTSGVPTRAQLNNVRASVSSSPTQPCEPGSPIPRNLVYERVFAQGDWWMALPSAEKNIENGIGALYFFEV